MATQSEKERADYLKTRRAYLQNRVSQIQDALRKAGLSSERKKALQDKLKNFKDNLLKIKSNSSLEETDMAKSLKQQYRESINKDVTTAAPGNLASLRRQAATKGAGARKGGSGGAGRSFDHLGGGSSRNSDENYTSNKEDIDDLIEQYSNIYNNARKTSRGAGSAKGGGGRSRFDDYEDEDGHIDLDGVLNGAGKGAGARKGAGGGSSNMRPSDVERELEAYGIDPRKVQEYLRSDPDDIDTLMEDLSNGHLNKKPTPTKETPKGAGTAKGASDVERPSKKDSNAPQDLDTQIKELEELLDYEYTKGGPSPATKKMSEELEALQATKKAATTRKVGSAKGGSGGSRATKGTGKGGSRASKGTGKGGSSGKTLRPRTSNTRPSGSSRGAGKGSKPSSIEEMQKELDHARDNGASHSVIDKLSRKLKLEKQKEADRNNPKKLAQEVETAINEVKKLKADPNASASDIRIFERHLADKLKQMKDLESKMSSTPDDTKKAAPAKKAPAKKAPANKPINKKLPKSKPKNLDFDDDLEKDEQRAYKKIDALIERMTKTNNPTQVEKLRKQANDLFKGLPLATRKKLKAMEMSPDQVNKQADFSIENRKGAPVKKAAPAKKDAGSDPKTGKRYTKRGVTQMLKQLREQNERGRKGSNAQKQRDEDIKRLSKILKTLSSAQPLSLSQMHRISTVATSLGLEDDVVTANTVWGTAGTYKELAKALGKLGIKVTAQGLEDDFDNGDVENEGTKELHSHIDGVLGSKDFSALKADDGAMVYATLYLADMIDENGLKTFVENPKLRKLALKCRS